MKKDYYVYFQGFFTIEADSEAEAMDQGYEAVKKAGATFYEITSAEEIKDAE